MKGKPTAQPPSATLTARVCTFCGKGKGTTCFRQDGGPFFAHLKCFNDWRKRMTADAKRLEELEAADASDPTSVEHEEWQALKQKVGAR